MFDLVDRYMLLHVSGLEPHEALRQVGNYHTSRIIPVLLMSVAGLLGAMLTPHLSHDWEAGRRSEVSDRLNLALKLLSLALLAAGTGALVVAPALFEYGFANKFPAGLAVLPWTLTYCSWFGLFAVAQNYLWCAERAGRASVALVIGLLINVAMNFAFLPQWGLHGAVWAASIANCVTLATVYWFCASAGMKVHRGTWLLSLAPVALGGGWLLALLTVVLLVALAVATEWLFDRREQRELAATARRTVRRVARRLFKDRQAPGSASGVDVSHFPEPTR
jgi:O-antigen/teichoic acid export membrane protein